MVKVLSFKTSDELYNKVKATGKTTREILEPLLIKYLSEREGYTNSKPQNSNNQDETINQLQNNEGIFDIDRMTKEMVDVIEEYFKKKGIKYV